MQFAIVVSDFNAEITEKLLEGARAKFAEQKIDTVDVVHVPGAIEIPLIAKLLARSQRYSAIICLGAVIRGETSHYDYVCQQVSQGCQQVMMEFELPVIFGVLTTENLAQALDRVGGAEGHKGEEAVDAALKMVRCVAEIKHI